MNVNPPPFYMFRAFQKSINVVYIVIARRLLFNYIRDTTIYSLGFFLSWSYSTISMIISMYHC